MARIRSRDTAPEMAVRRLLHRLGFRYRLHRKDLPGRPDLVFPGRRKVVFVHGCFWHSHGCREGRRMPGTHPEYWAAKLQRNQERDLRHLADLATLGWETLIVWECEIRQEGLQDRLVAFLDAALEAPARDCDF